MILTGLLISLSAFGQADRKDVRKGNRQFRKERFADADLSYRHALLADSTSVPAAYNLAGALFREGDFDGAGKSLQQAQRHIGELRTQAKQADAAFDTYFNLGDVALQKKDYRSAVDAFAQALLVNPDDLEAKENFIYAQKMLKDNSGGGGGDDQNQNQDQDQNQNQDQNKDQNQDNQQDQDPQKQDQDPNQGQQPRQPELSPQQAAQLLQAIQAKEQETQEKVDAKKAEALKSRQKEKNW